MSNTLPLDPLYFFLLFCFNLFKKNGVTIWGREVFNFLISLSRGFKERTNSQTISLDSIIQSPTLAVFLNCDPWRSHGSYVKDSTGCRLSCLKIYKATLHTLHEKIAEELYMIQYPAIHIVLTEMTYLYKIYIFWCHRKPPFYLNQVGRGLVFWWIFESWRENNKY